MKSIPQQRAYVEECLQVAGWKQKEQKQSDYKHQVQFKDDTLVSTKVLEMEAEKSKSGRDV